MASFIEGILTASSNGGRYQVGSTGDAPDVTNGDRLDVQIGGQWIAGSVEHGRVYLVSQEHIAARGYFFIADTDGMTCGLCIGMSVRLHS